MAFRRWDRAKIAMLWVLDVATLVVIWQPCDIDRFFGISITKCLYQRDILIWLLLSLPLFILTWKWASARETPKPLGPETTRAQTVSVASSKRTGRWHELKETALVRLLKPVMFATLIGAATILIYLPSTFLEPYLMPWVGQEYSGGLSLLVVSIGGILIIAFWGIAAEQLSKLRDHLKGRSPHIESVLDEPDSVSDILFAAINSKNKGRVLVIKTKYGSEFQGRVVRHEGLSMLVYSKTSEKLMNFNFGEIQSVSLSNEELALPHKSLPNLSES